MKKRLLSIMVGVALLLTMMSTAFATPGANMPSGDTQLEAGGALGFEITVSKDSTGKKATVSLDSGTNTVNIVIYDAAKEPDGLSTNGYPTMSSDVYDQEGNQMTRGTDYDHNSGTDVQRKLLQRMSHFSTEKSSQTSPNSCLNWTAATWAEIQLT